MRHFLLSLTLSLCSAITFAELSTDERAVALAANFLMGRIEGYCVDLAPSDAKLNDAIMRKRKNKIVDKAPIFAGNIVYIDQYRNMYRQYKQGGGKVAPQNVIEVTLSPSSNDVWIEIKVAANIKPSDLLQLGFWFYSEFGDPLDARRRANADVGAWSQPFNLEWRSTMLAQALIEGKGSWERMPSIALDLLPEIKAQSISWMFEVPFFGEDGDTYEKYKTRYHKDPNAAKHVEFGINPDAFDPNAEPHFKFAKNLTMDQAKQVASWLFVNFLPGEASAPDA